MLKDKCVLNDFECFVLIVLLNSLKNRFKVVYVEEGYLIIQVSADYNILFDFVVHDDHGYFRNHACISLYTTLSDIDICCDKQKILMFVDYIHTMHHHMFDCCCVYDDNVVPLLCDELYYHSEYCAIRHEDQIKFVLNSEIAPLPKLVTESNPNLNQYGTNSALKGVVKSASAMKSYGFRYMDFGSGPYWIYTKSLESLPELEIDLYIFPNSYDIRVDVMWDDNCQVYDYQGAMNHNPYSMLPRKVFHEVDKLMRDIQNNGIITGYYKGMYI